MVVDIPSCTVKCTTRRDNKTNTQREKDETWSSMQRVIQPECKLTICPHLNPTGINQKEEGKN